jgi:hypothetical protein
MPSAGLRAVTGEQVEFASDFLKLYLPITIEVLSLPEGSEKPGP